MMSIQHASPKASRQEVGMEKISGIIPSSARVTSVDMKESPPVRSGTPTFGRAESVPSARKAKIGETASVAAGMNKERLDWKSKDMQNAAVARDLSDRFFTGNQKTAGKAVQDIDPMKPVAITSVASTPAGFKSQEIDRVTGSGAFAGAISGEVDDDFSEIGVSLPPVSLPSTGPSSSSVGAEVSQPDGLYPRGSFIDFQA